MSVQNETNRVQYWGNGSTTTAYPVPFYFFESGDLRVVVTDAEGNDAELEEGGGYSVAGAGNENGGSVWTVSIVPVTSRVTIYREVSAVQTTVYEENGEFPAKSHERALDRQTMLNQQNARAFDRSLKVRESDGEKSPLTTVENSVIGFGADRQPRTFTPAQLAVWLNLTQNIFGEGTKTWLTDGDREAAVPDFLGQVGVQVSNASLWVANGTSAGNWADPVPGIVDGSIATVKLANGVLSADTAGRAKMADSFLTLAKIGAGVFTADSAGRGKFASGFVDSSLCASGLWNAIAPVGAVLQTIYSSTTTALTISAAIPDDDTKPQITEGTQIFSASITPTSAINKVRVRFCFSVGRYTNSNPFVTAAVFNGASDAIYAVYQNVNALANEFYGEIIDSPATTSAKTYSLRVGPHGGETLYINGYYGKSPRVLGGASVAIMILEEIKA